MNKEKMPQRGRNKRLLVIAIVAVSVLIVAGIGYFFYLIYHRDEPKFVPGDTRGEIREGIKEKIAVPIANVWPAIGEPMVAAVYKSPTTETESPDSTADWQTYKNEELGVEIKYPDGWEYLKGPKENTFSFAPNEDSYDGVHINANQTFSTVEGYWANYINTVSNEIVFKQKQTINIGDREIYLYQQDGGLEETHYILKYKNIIFDFIPTGEGYEYSEEIINTLN